MKYYKCIAKELSSFGFIFKETDQYFILNNVNNLIIGGIFTEVSETEWVQQEIDEGRLIALPKYWCVKNDGSQLFKDTVINFINEMEYNNYPGNDCYCTEIGWLGYEINKYYGIDYNDTNSISSMWDDPTQFANNPIVLTLNQFIKLVGCNSTKGDDFMKSIHVERPPIGLRPKDIYKTETTINRYYEVYGAIVRYLNDGLPVNISWIEEYNELIKNPNLKSSINHI